MDEICEELRSDRELTEFYLRELAKLQRANRIAI